MFWGSELFDGDRRNVCVAVGEEEMGGGWFNGGWWRYPAAAADRGGCDDDGGAISFILFPLAFIRYQIIS